MECRSNRHPTTSALSLTSTLHLIVAMVVPSSALALPVIDPMHLPPYTSFVHLTSHANKYVANKYTSISVSAFLLVLVIHCLLFLYLQFRYSQTQVSSSLYLYS